MHSWFPEKPDYRAAELRGQLRDTLEQAATQGLSYDYLCNKLRQKPEVIAAWRKGQELFLYSPRELEGLIGSVSALVAQRQMLEASRPQEQPSLAAPNAKRDSVSMV